MPDLSTVKNREALKARREPYWQKLAGGQFLGYRPSAVGKGGNWIARSYDSDTQKQHFHRLGDFGQLPANERFAAASAEARQWFTHLAGGGSHDTVTVRQACERYASNHRDAAKRFERYVYGDPIAKITLQKLTDRHVREWRKRLEDRPALVTRSKTSDPVTRPRAAATLNRDMVPFRAALNLALAQGLALSARAWHKALEPVEAHGRRNLYLDRDQRRELLKHFPPDAAAFAHALCLLPLRPGAMSALTVGDFDVRRKELVIDRDKSGGGRKILVSNQAGNLLTEQSRLKVPTAPLFARADGREWNKDSWKGPFKDAAKAAELPAGTTAYVLRHSTITDLVQGGLPLLTIAQISGTSVRMIEKTYGHLRQEQAAEALEQLSL